MHPSKDKLIVLSVGGSLVVPKTGIDVSYLKDFRSFILKQVKNGYRFIIVVGGGRTARQYQEAANALVSLAEEDVDWLGIHATRLNGHLLRSLFRDIALHRVVKDPTRKIVWNKKVLIAAGWKPGWSTDYVAVKMAKQYGSKLVINLSNINAVYDRDPNLDLDAKKFDRMTWKQFRAIVGHEWHPGANHPFDPVASRLADQSGMTVVVTGKDFKNLNNILIGKPFKGTTIS
jgi:uridylate kinase